MPTYKLKVKELNTDFLEVLQREYAEADIEITIHAAPGESTAFGEVDFWKVISLLNWSKGEDIKAILEPAISYLAQQDIDSITLFEDILAEKLYQLDKKAYAENLGDDSWRSDGPFSSDNFLYARACVVANGASFYYKVLRDPSLMPKDFTFEPLLSLAGKAYERKTGKPFNYFSPISYETFSNPEGWDETLRDRLLNS